MELQCRACHIRLSTKDNVVCLKSPGNRNLYEKCTYISLPPLIQDNVRPQQLCQKCYEFCLAWLEFKAMCNEHEQNNCLYSRRRDLDLRVDPMDSIELYKHDDPTVELADGTLDEVVLRVDEEEDDLLVAILEGNFLDDHSVGGKPVTTVDYNHNEIKCKEKKVDDVSLDEMAMIAREVHGDVQLEDHNDHVQGSVEAIEEILTEVEIFDLSSETSNHSEDQFFVPENSIVTEENSTNISSDCSSSKESLKGSEDGIEYWVCSICDANLIDAEAFRDHLKFHLEEEDGRRVPKKRKLGIQWENEIEQSMQGVMRQVKFNNWNCPLCVVSHSNRELLEDHLRLQHNLDDHHMCPICPISEANKEEIGRRLLKHILKEHVQKFKCQFCFEEFQTFRHFIKHIQAMHNIKNHIDQFRSCPLCEDACKAAGLKEHLDKQHDVNDECLNCPSCSAQYESSEGVIAHIISFHATKWTCDICAKPFFSTKSFNQHYGNHRKNGERGIKRAKYFCQICGKLFIKHKDFAAHNSTFHSEEKKVRIKLEGQPIEVKIS